MKSPSDYIINAKVIVYASLGGMVSFLPDGAIHGCNHHFSLMLFGYSQEELLKKVRPCSDHVCFSPAIKSRFSTVGVGKGERGRERERENVGLKMAVYIYNIYIYAIMSLQVLFSTVGVGKGERGRERECWVENGRVYIQHIHICDNVTPSPVLHCGCGEGRERECWVENGRVYIQHIHICC